MTMTFALLLTGSVQLFATDYTLTGHNEVAAFVNAAGLEKETVGKLIIKDGTPSNRVTEDDLKGVPIRVGAITELIEWNGLLDVAGTDWFFGEIQCCKASIHLINCPELVWLQGFGVETGINKDAVAAGGNGGYRKIDGDFIITGCPKIAAWSNDGWPNEKLWDGIREVGGDFIISGVTGTKINGGAFMQLKKVGGNFEISGCTQLNRGINYGSLEYVGGDFTLKNNKNWDWISNEVGYGWAQVHLDGIDKIQYVGGKVKLINNDKMPTYDVWHLGYCYAKYMKEQGIFIGDLIIGKSEQSPYDLNLIESCPSGFSNKPEPNYPLAISTIEAGKAVRIFMSPDQSLVVNSGVNVDKVEVSDLSGKIVLSLSDLTAGVNYLNPYRLAKGVYVVKVTTEYGQVETAKIIKQ
jgi:hypothetical protein